ncbi:MAG: hypothetical protein GX091_10900, partial [Peptococcaceae bacterium]|nr:hypothetical protein [Peptococcaceae bacterium]
MITTKYYQTWAEYLAAHPEISFKEEKVMAPVMQKYEDAFFDFIMYL